MERLDKLNRDFVVSKEQIYNDKTEDIERDIHDILSGRHAEYLDHVQELEMTRDEEILKAEIIRDYQIQVAEALYRAEIEDCINDFEHEKDNLKQRIMQSIDDRKRKLKDDKDNFDIHNGTLTSHDTNLFIVRCAR
jgi:hypothetical protein